MCLGSVLQTNLRRVRKVRFLVWKVPLISYALFYFFPLDITAVEVQWCVENNSVSSRIMAYSSRRASIRHPVRSRRKLEIQCTSEKKSMTDLPIAGATGRGSCAAERLTTKGRRRILMVQLYFLGKSYHLYNSAGSIRIYHSKSYIPAMLCYATTGAEVNITVSAPVGQVTSHRNISRSSHKSTTALIRPPPCLFTYSDRFVSHIFVFFEIIL
jgi:hypothetical protein